MIIPTPLTCCRIRYKTAKLASKLIKVNRLICYFHYHRQLYGGI